MRVCVVGLGAMGIAAARSLAARGHRVIGLDRHGVANGIGSSAYDWRIFRLAHERPEYVRLARKALMHWRELERRDGVALLRATGLLEIGGPHAAIVTALRSESVTVTELDGADVADLCPGLAPRHGRPARWQPAAGVLSARDCLLVQADAAACDGAEIAVEGVIGIDRHTDRVTIRTTDRQLEADVVVIAAGPWTNDLVRPLGLDLPLAPALGQTSLFRGQGWGRQPCLIEWLEGQDVAYGLPVEGVGFQLGISPGAPFVPDDEDRRPDHAEAMTLSRHVAAGFAGLDAHPLRSARCPWTMTADGDFIIDRDGPLVIAAGCSGQAFKFSPAIGELIADLCEGGEADPMFRLGRPALRAVPQIIS